MAVKPEEILSRIHLAFPDAKVSLKDTVGDMDHYALHIESAMFEGLSKVNQHKMVMKALGSMVGTTLHAISITTTTNKGMSNE
jgi:stress-induced morphogen